MSKFFLRRMCVPTSVIPIYRKLCRLKSRENLRYDCMTLCVVPFIYCNDVSLCYEIWENRNVGSLFIAQPQFCTAVHWRIGKMFRFRSKTVTNNWRTLRWGNWKFFMTNWRHWRRVLRFTSNRETATFCSSATKERSCQRPKRNLPSWKENWRTRVRNRETNTDTNHLPNNKFIFVQLQCHGISAVARWIYRNRTYRSQDTYIQLIQEESALLFFKLISISHAQVFWHFSGGRCLNYGPSCNARNNSCFVPHRISQMEWSFEKCPCQKITLRSCQCLLQVCKMSFARWSDHIQTRRVAWTRLVCNCSNFSQWIRCFKSPRWVSASEWKGWIARVTHVRSESSRHACSQK